MSRVSSIVFDKHERPKRATIITSAGTIKVHWVEDYGDRNWFTSGPTDARKLAVTTIERIERMAERL